jgi:signal transduction histidine kinase
LFIQNGYRHLGVETVEISIGGARVYLSNNSVGIVEEGFYLSCWGTQRDITEQRLAENQVNESREQLRALLERLQRAQEDERASVSREIHDELGQSLTGLKMDLSWLERKLSEPGLSGVNPLLERAVAASELVDSTIERVQKLAAELRPVALDQLGLAAALTALARRFQKQCEVPCTLEVVEPIPGIPPDVANELFYICQEALTNVARHAGASTIQIRLRKEGLEILLEVIDDGKGIDEGRAGATNSLGLLGMRERALKFGGMVEIRKLEASGTAVLARIPFVPLSRADEGRRN